MIFSATLRNSPQTKKASEPAKTKGCRELSANPQNPQPIKGQEPQNPDAVLLEIARTLKADAHMLRALLSDDDMQAIAENCPGYERGKLADYFRLMEKDGKALADPQWHLDRLLKSAGTKRRQIPHSCTQWDKAWKAAHELFIDHVMGCKDCRAPQGHYCATGQKHRQAYLSAYEVTSS